MNITKALYKEPRFDAIKNSIITTKTVNRSALIPTKLTDIKTIYRPDSRVWPVFIMKFHLAGRWVLPGAHVGS